MDAQAVPASGKVVGPFFVLGEIQTDLFLLGTHA
jgi:hypothetical protein